MSNSGNTNKNEESFGQELEKEEQGLRREEQTFGGPHCQPRGQTMEALAWQIEARTFEDWPADVTLDAFGVDLIHKYAVYVAQTITLRETAALAIP